MFVKFINSQFLEVTLHVLLGRGDMLLHLHQEQQSREQEKLAKHCKKCCVNPEKYLGMVIDGMDQKKTRLPHWPSPPKSAD